MLHCAGGPGCDNVDWISLIVDWVEKSKAPDKIVATKSGQGNAVTKDIFPYPKE
jgi:feruloyl esterase